MFNIGGFGAAATLAASNTFPNGFSITQFADDADPLDQAAIDIKDAAMGLNGDLVAWSKAVPIPVTLNVIPGSDDDLNLAVIAKANRVGAGKMSANDVITLIVVYPDDTKVTLTGGVMTNANLMSSISSAGRMKTKAYQFKFEDII